MNFEKGVFSQDVASSDILINEKIDKLLEDASTLEDDGELLRAGKKIMKAGKMAKTFHYKDELYNRAYELLIKVDGDEAEKCLSTMNKLKR